MPVETLQRSMWISLQYAHPFMPQQPTVGSGFKNVTVIGHPLIEVKLTSLRDRTTTPEEFRRKLTELASVMAFEVTRNLETVAVPVETPLETATGARLAKPQIIA